MLLLIIFFQGRKMSKTLGNVIDPIDTIKEFGTDALRFSIALGTAGQVSSEFFQIAALVQPVNIVYLLIYVTLPTDLHCFVSGP